MAEHAPPLIFNRSLVRRRRARAARNFSQYDFLHRRAMGDIVDRLESVTRDFPHACFFGAGDLTALLTPACGVARIVSGDLTPLRIAAASRYKIVFDEEKTPFAHEQFDLIVSLLTLHNVNDLVGALAQARMALRPDGLFIAAVFGEETLGALRAAIYAAESAIAGGVSARIAPFAGVQGFGQALGRAGFALPVADVDKVKVRYGDPRRLLNDLRGMGETRTLAAPAAPFSRRVLLRAMENFTAAGGEEKFEIVYLTGWAPHESQQKPLKPGSGKMSFEKAVRGG